MYTFSSSINYSWVLARGSPYGKITQRNINKYTQYLINYITKVSCSIIFTLIRYVKLKATSKHKVKCIKQTHNTCMQACMCQLYVFINITLKLTLIFLYVRSWTARDQCKRFPRSQHTNSIEIVRILHNFIFLNC